MTIRAVIRNGMIQPTEELPVTWLEGQTLSVEEVEEPGDCEEIRAWAGEIEEVAAQIPAAEHQRFIEALAEHRREAKDYMRRRMASS